MKATGLTCLMGSAWIDLEPLILVTRPLVPTIRSASSLTTGYPADTLYAGAVYNADTGNYLFHTDYNICTSEGWVHNVIVDEGLL